MEDQAQKLREMMRAGYRAEGLEEKIENNNTRFISVTSGKGGVGKTNIALNIALEYVQLNKKVLIIDADLGMANVNILLGVVPKYTLYNIISQGKTLKEIVTHTDCGIDLIAGSSGTLELTDLDVKDIEKLIKELLKIYEYDVIIIDTSAGISRQVLSFLLSSDDIIIVTTPEPTALTDAYGVIKALSYTNREINNLRLIVNRVNNISEANLVSKKVVNVTSQFLNLKIDYLGYVYEDPNVRISVHKQKPFILYSPNTKASYCIKDIIATLERVKIRANDDGKTGILGFISKFFGID